MRKNRFLREAQNVLSQMREIRRDLHRNPEVGMEEIRTSRLVAEYLEDLGIEVKTGVGGTGVIGTIYTKEGGRTVAIRADMDALAMEDKKSVPYASSKRGMAHSCGHDGYTAMLLGTAKILCKFSDCLNKGNVRFVFQPSEDRLPGGAIPMISGGALRNPKVDGIFSLHLDPGFREGLVAVKSGYSTISSAEFVLTMIGKGGHVAYPHRIADPVVMAGMVIVAGQTIVARRVDPLNPTIVAFCSVKGGTANNVVPDEVTLTGTIRTLKPETRDGLARLLEETAQGAAQIGGGDHRLSVEMGYPSVFNHPDMVGEFKNSACKIAGPESVMDVQVPSMTGEDISYFHQKIPGVNWHLGIANPERGFIHPLHSPVFDFNEEVMPLGAAIHAQSAVDFLINRQGRPLTHHSGR